MEVAHTGITCSETGKPIVGARYFASYVNHNSETVQINLSEEAFAEPNSFDHMPLVYFRFARPLKAESPLPEPVDLSKLHENKNNKSFGLTYKLSPLDIIDKQFLIDKISCLDDSDDNEGFLNMLKQLLPNGYKFEKQIQQLFVDNDNKDFADQMDRILNREHKDALRYLNGDVDAGGFSTDQKKLLDTLSKFTNGENFH